MAKIDKAETLFEFAEALHGTSGIIQSGTPTAVPMLTDVYCPTCGAWRKPSVVLECGRPAWVIAPQKAKNDETEKADENGRIWTFTCPTLFILTCLQCHGAQTGLFFQGPKGPELAIFAAAYGGVSTPLTPDSVKYYLEQAHRAQAISALSACVAMFRVALEHLLLDQGYKGMLGQQVNALLADRTGGKGPPWVSRLDEAYFTAIKEVGNGSLHTNGGDISKQAALDSEVIASLRAVFAELLEVIYEAPARSAAHLKKLQQAAAVVKK